MDEVSQESVIESLIFSIDSCINQNYSSFYQTLVNSKNCDNAILLLPTPQTILNNDPAKHIDAINLVLNSRQDCKPGYDLPRSLRLRLKRTKHFLNSKFYFNKELETIRLKRKHLDSIIQPQAKQHQNTKQDSNIEDSSQSGVSITKPFDISDPQHKPISYKYPISSISSSNAFSVKKPRQLSVSSRPESPILSPDLWPISKFTNSYLNIPDQIQTSSESYKDSSSHKPSVGENEKFQPEKTRPKFQDAPQPNFQQKVTKSNDTKTPYRHSANTPSNTLDNTTNISTPTSNYASGQYRRPIKGSPIYFHPVSVYESIVLEGLMYAIQTAELPFTEQGEISELVWCSAFNTWTCIRSITNNEIGDIQTFKDWYRHKLHVFRIINHGKSVPEWQWIPKEYRLEASQKQINNFAHKKTYRRQAFEPFPLGPCFEELNALFPSASKHRPLNSSTSYGKTQVHLDSKLDYVWDTVKHNTQPLDSTCATKNKSFQPSNDAHENDLLSTVTFHSQNPIQKSNKVESECDQNPKISFSNRDGVSSLLDNANSVTKSNRSFIAAEGILDPEISFSTQSHSKCDLLNEPRTSTQNESELRKDARQGYDNYTLSKRHLDSDSLVPQNASQNGLLLYNDANKDASPYAGKDLDRLNVTGYNPYETDDFKNSNKSLEFYGIELSDDGLEDKGETEGPEVDNGKMLFRKSSRKKKMQMLFDEDALPVDISSVDEPPMDNLSMDETPMVTLSVHSSPTGSPTLSDVHDSRPSVIYEDPNESNMDSSSPASQKPSLFTPLTQYSQFALSDVDTNSKNPFTKFNVSDKVETLPTQNLHTDAEIYWFGGHGQDSHTSEYVNEGNETNVVIDDGLATEKAYELGQGLASNNKYHYVSNTEHHNQNQNGYYENRCEELQSPGGDDSHFDMNTSNETSSYISRDLYSSSDGEMTSEVDETSLENKSFCSEDDFRGRYDDGQSNYQRYNAQAPDDTVGLDSYLTPMHSQNAYNPDNDTPSISKSKKEYIGIDQEYSNAHDKNIRNSDKMYKTLLQFPYKTVSQQHLLESQIQLDSSIYNDKQFSHMPAEQYSSDYQYISSPQYRTPLRHTDSPLFVRTG